MNENTCAHVLQGHQELMERQVIPAKLAKEDFLDQLVLRDEVARTVILEWMETLEFRDCMDHVE